MVATDVSQLESCMISGHPEAVCRLPESQDEALDREGMEDGGWRDDGGNEVLMQA